MRLRLVASHVEGAEKVSVLEFDSKWFGVRVGRFDNDPKAAYGWAIDNDIQLLYTLLPIDKIALMRDASEHGFRLVDVRVQFTAPSNDLPLPDRVRPAKADDDERIGKIALTAFRGGSRFYNDRHMDRDRVDEMYRNWAINDVYDALVLVADGDDGIGGFVTVRGGDVGLIAVDPECRWTGIGTDLMNAALSSCQERQLLVVTQGGNTAAQRTFQKCGFRSSSTGLWLHRWFV